MDDDGAGGASGDGDGSEPDEAARIAAELPDGWTVWNAESGGQVILAFRPDLFEGERFPAPCLPTITVTRNHPDRNPMSAADGSWHVLLYLEPEVRVREREASAESREAAIEAACDVAAAFAAGEVDVRGAYQIPREAYLDELDATLPRRED